MNIYSSIKLALKNVEFGAVGKGIFKKTVECDVQQFLYFTTDSYGKLYLRFGLKIIDVDLLTYSMLMKYGHRNLRAVLEKPRFPHDCFMTFGLEGYGSSSPNYFQGTRIRDVDLEVLTFKIIRYLEEWIFPILTQSLTVRDFNLRLISDFGPFQWKTTGSFIIRAYQIALTSRLIGINDEEIQTSLAPYKNKIELESKTLISTDALMGINIFDIILQESNAII